MRSPSATKWRQANVDAVRASAGVADQDTTCPNGDPDCGTPGGVPCFDCLMNGGDQNDV